MSRYAPPGSAVYTAPIPHGHTVTGFSVSKQREPTRHFQCAGSTMGSFALHAAKTRAGLSCAASNPSRRSKLRRMGSVISLMAACCSRENAERFCTTVMPGSELL